MMKNNMQNNNNQNMMMNNQGNNQMSFNNNQNNLKINNINSYSRMKYKPNDNDSVYCTVESNNSSIDPNEINEIKNIVQVQYVKFFSEDDAYLSDLICDEIKNNWDMKDSFSDIILGSFNELLFIDI